jgi:hypothetical protein
MVRPAGVVTGLVLGPVTGWRRVLLMRRIRRLGMPGRLTPGLWRRVVVAALLLRGRRPAWSVPAGRRAVVGLTWTVCVMAAGMLAGCVRPVSVCRLGMLWLSGR